MERTKPVLRKVLDSSTIREIFTGAAHLLNEADATLFFDGIARNAKLLFDFPTETPESLEFVLLRPSTIANPKTVWMELELFERCYRARCGFLDSFDDRIFLTFPDYIEEIFPRTARRVCASGAHLKVNDNNYEIGNLSELGALVLGELNIEDSFTSILNIGHHKIPLSFKIVERLDTQTRIEFSHDSNTQAMIAEALLTYKYPSLTLRSPERYEDLWKLYESTGYLRLRKDPLYFEEQKDLLFSAWRDIDSAKPRTADVTVISLSQGEAIASIGNSAFGSHGLYGHSIAFTVDPSHLTSSRECYLWLHDHTMANLRDDGLCLASMNSTTKFHDRFYYRFQHHFSEQIQCPYFWIYAFRPSKKAYHSNATLPPVRICDVSGIVAATENNSNDQRAILQILNSLWDSSVDTYYGLSPSSGLIAHADHKAGISMSGFHEAYWLFPPKDVSESEISETISILMENNWKSGHAFVVHVVPYDSNSPQNPFPLTNLSPTYLQLNRLFICRKDLVPSYYGHSLRVFNEMAKKYKS